MNRATERERTENADKKITKNTTDDDDDDNDERTTGKRVASGEGVSGRWSKLKITGASLKDGGRRKTTTEVAGTDAGNPLEPYTKRDAFGTL